jgi:hypothetical protein
MPRAGHLEQASHIFGYLKSHPKRKIGFDQSHPGINENRFQKCDWEEFYRDASEAIPENKPEPGGKSMPISSMQKAVAAGTVRVSKEDTLTNLADIFTKTMAAPKRENLLYSFTY